MNIYIYIYIYELTVAKWGADDEPDSDGDAEEVAVDVFCEMLDVQRQRLAILLLGLEAAADQCLHGPDIARRCSVVSGLGIGAARRATKSWDVATLLALEIHLGLGRWGGSPCRRRRRLAWVLAGEPQF